MATRSYKKKNSIDFGSMALAASRYGETSSDAKAELKRKYEAELRAIEEERRTQQKEFEQMSSLYKHECDVMFAEKAPDIFRLFGLKIESDLQVVLADEKNIELLNKTNDFSGLISKEKVILDSLKEFFAEHSNICQEIREFVEYRYLEFESETESSSEKPEADPETVTETEEHL